MNVFLYELRTNLRSAVSWTLALSLTGLMMCVAVFPAFHSDMQSLEAIMASYPPELLQAMGLGEIGLSSFPGFYAFCFLYIALCCGIQALILGIGIISKEGARKTCDFLFSKPISRARILAGKLSAAAVCLLLTSGVYFAVCLISAKAVVQELDVSVLCLMNLSLFLTQLLFLAIGFCVGCCVRKIKSPTTVGIGMGALFFALQMLSNLFPDDKIAVRLISPMGYISPNYIAEHGVYEWPMLCTLILFTAALTMLGFVRYKTKDIHSA